MSDNVKLGALIVGKDPGRDAVHVAVAPVWAAETLRPGDHVGLTSQTEAAMQGTYPIGIVDPFLKRVVHKGERFWLFLYPGSITSLRHQWSHPAFAAENFVEGTKESSVEWIEDFAEKNDVSYDDLVRAGRTHWTNGGCGFTVPDEFWTHWERVTGKRANRTDYFSCIC